MKYSIPYPNITSVGVELEGGMPWPAVRTLEREYAHTRRFRWGHDGSVNVHPPLDYDWSRGDWAYDIELRYWSDDVEDLLGFVKRCFELGLRQNRTCGNHHHFKFARHTIVCTLLARPATYKRFARMYARFADSMDRLYGTTKYRDRMGNRYCAVPSNVDALRNALTAYDRYVALNFHALVKHGTFEVRILPYASGYDEFVKMHLWLCRAMNRLADWALKNADKLLSVEVTL